MLRWQIWSTLWSYVSHFLRYINPFQSKLTQSVGTALDEDVEQCRTLERQLHHSSKSPSEESSHFIIEEYSIATEQTSNRKLLRIGIFAQVHLLDGTVIRKVPCSESEEHKQPILREATIYAILGQHPRIAQYLSHGKTDYIDIKYYPYGDLAAYTQNNKDKITPDLQSKWFQQIIEAVVKIHEHDVVHSDLALRQFFLDDDLNVRLGDFNSSQYPGHVALGYEKASHCLPRDYDSPNTVMSDLFALGSTLYELVAGKAPYSELYPVEPEDVMRSKDHTVIRARIQRQQQVDLEIEARYKDGHFPDVACLFGGKIILGCWEGSISSAKDALVQCMALVGDVQDGNIEYKGTLQTRSGIGFD
ncbi:serine/threonine protein kinase [Emydomyces testavorans]|uniref:Serine/threonine protein kinase n=1 Tax=Emydomyces testavorans TaxID=2070801 RepID=A0AAF0DKS0_9EURO|nr:serine/threonine protein kinase [Emydomyces testavorans]